MSLITHFQDVSPLTPLASEVDHTSSGSAGSATCRSTGLASPVVGSPQGSSTENVISRFLVPSVGTPSGPKIALPKARLLTSIEALAILEEKERKKQQAEEKEQEEWTGSKEAGKTRNANRKPAERARKAEERAKEKTHKAEEKARKAEKAQKAEEKTRKAEEKA